MGGGRRAILAAFHEQSFAKTISHPHLVLGGPGPVDPRRGPSALRDAFDKPRAEHIHTDLHDPIDAAIYEATRPRRITPGERFVAHRSYPSPRSVFAAYATRHPDALVRVQSDHLRLPIGYGALRRSLAGLEAGHLAAVVQLLLRHLGVTSVHLPADGLLVRTPAGSAPFEALVAGLWSPPHTVSTLLTARTSNPPETFGLSTLALADKIQSRLLTTAQLAVRATEAQDERAPVIHVHGAARPSKTIHRLGGEGIVDETWRADMIAPLPSTFGIQLSTSFTDWIDRHGRDAPLALHSTLGWIGQWVCLAAADAGIAARPMRGFDEASWASATRLPPGVVPTYQLWFEPVRTTPFSMELSE